MLVGAGSVLGVALLALAAIMALTAVVGFCPLYPLLGISTCPLGKTTTTA
ncbi:MAG: YgaP-like transmembrane domain [Gaiella sp.]